MFAYCGNNPVNNADTTGRYYCKIDFNPFAPFDSGLVPISGGLAGDGGDFGIGWSALSGQDISSLAPRYTKSVGISVSSSWGGNTGGAAVCLSQDSSGMYAVQDASSLGASTGAGVSACVTATYTNASNVLDLAGISDYFGFSIGDGISVCFDVVTFIPTSDPSSRKWGISVGVGLGAGFEIHMGQSNTISGNAWNPQDWWQ